jgi:Putative transposase/Transposase zinc-binding domain
VRPTVAAVFRRHGPAYLCDHTLVEGQAKVLRSVIACRTAALGGHLDVCRDCGVATPSYNSCRDRHCPNCQASAAKRWLDKQLNRVLATPYFHVVFTLPAQLRAIALANPKLVYDLLFSAAEQTLQDAARSRLHAQLGITAVLHTWTREMGLHPHLHCIVTGGGLSGDGTKWIAGRQDFLFPVKVMGRLLRGKFMDGLVHAHKVGKLHFTGTSAEFADPLAFAKLRHQLYRTDWVVFAKKPFGGPEQVMAYLSRYTHRVAISNSRILAHDDERIVIKTRGEARCALAPAEFIRRFLLHVLPHGFRKIRHYGLLAPSNVNTRRAVAAELLRQVDLYRDMPVFEPGQLLGQHIPITKPPPCCPACGSVNLRREDVPRPARGPP